MISEPMLSHVVAAAGGVVRVALRGEIDMSTVGDLMAWIEGAAHTHPGLPVEVDMAAVRFMDSSGVSTLVRARRGLAEAGTELTVVNAQDPVLTVLTATGVYEYLCKRPPAAS